MHKDFNTQQLVDGCERQPFRVDKCLSFFQAVVAKVYFHHFQYHRGLHLSLCCSVSTVCEQLQIMTEPLPMLLYHPRYGCDVSSQAL